MAKPLGIFSFLQFTQFFLPADEESAKRATESHGDKVHCGLDGGGGSAPNLEMLGDTRDENTEAVHEPVMDIRQEKGYSNNTPSFQSSIWLMSTRSHDYEGGKAANVTEDCSGDDRTATGQRDMQSEGIPVRWIFARTELMQYSDLKDTCLIVTFTCYIKVP